MNTAYNSRQKRIFLLVSIIILSLVLFFGLYGYISAFFGAGILYVLFRQPFTYLSEKLGWNKNLAVTVVFLFSFFIIILPFIGLSVVLTRKILEYSSRVDELLPLIQSLEKNLPFEIMDKSLLSNLAGKIGEWVSTAFPSVISGTLDIFIAVSILYFVLYYMFVNRREFIHGIYRYMPFEHEVIAKMGKELENSIKANIVGQGVISLAQGLFLGLGFWAFGVRDPIFWGVIGFFVSFVPVLGTPLIWVPAGVLQILDGKTGSGIGLLIFGAVVITNIDNVLRLYISKLVGNIHPLITIVGILYGVPIFGILGLVIGPLLFSYFLLLFRLYFNYEAEVVVQADDEA